MSIPTSSSTLRLPAGFQNLLEELALEVLRVQPTDVVAFAAQHFQRLLEQREESSADLAVWGAQLEDKLLSQPPFQEPEEDEEKEDKDKEEEKAGEQAGGGASTATVREAAPKQGDLSPNQHQG